MENRAHALIAGFFVLLASLCLAGVAWWFSGQREQVNQYVLVTQGSVTGLNRQAQVRYRGVLAGKVTDIRVDENNAQNLLVDIAINPKLPITQATRAHLAYQGVTGLAYIMLNEKSEGAPRLLPGEGRIPLAGGFMEQLTEGGAEMLEKLLVLTRKVDALLDQKNMNHIRSVFERSDRIAAQLEASTGELNAVLGQVKKMVQNEQIQSMAKILADLERGVSQVGPTVQDAQTLMKRLNVAVQRLNDTALLAGSDALPRINHLVSELTTTSQRVNRLLEEVNSSPQMVLFGREPIDPGPGEPGYAPVAP